jgi:hypothetical protein
LPIWNFPEENFYKEINVFIFIVASLTKWVNEEILKKYINFFWKQTILDAFEEHNDKVTDRFINIIRNKINDLV